MKKIFILIIIYNLGILYACNTSPKTPEKDSGGNDNNTNNTATIRIQNYTYSSSGSALFGVRITGNGVSESVARITGSTTITANDGGSHDFNISWDKGASTIDLTVMVNSVENSSANAGNFLYTIYAVSNGDKIQVRYIGGYETPSTTDGSQPEQQTTF